MRFRTSTVIIKRSSSNASHIRPLCPSSPSPTSPRPRRQHAARHDTRAAAAARPRASRRRPLAAQRRAPLRRRATAPAPTSAATTAAPPARACAGIRPKLLLLLGNVYVTALLRVCVFGDYSCRCIFCWRYLFVSWGAWIDGTLS